MGVPTQNRKAKHMPINKEWIGRTCAGDKCDTKLRDSDRRVKLCDACSLKAEQRMYELQRLSPREHRKAIITAFAKLDGPGVY